VTKVAAIFPFEAEVYRQAGADVVFVGHPLLDIVKPALPPQEARRLFGVEEGKPVVLLMPGSRRQEIDRLLPVMLAAMEEVTADLPECRFFLPVASTISREILQNIIDNYKIDVHLVTGNTYDLMNIADVAVAASGTATLEAAIMGLPTVIVYKMAAFTYMLGKLLVKIPDIGLPNIVAGRRIVPELIQGEANAANIARETRTILTDPAARERIIADLAVVKQKLEKAAPLAEWPTSYLKWPRRSWRKGMNLYIRLLKYIKPYLLQVGVALVCTVLAAAANLYVPWIIKDVIDDVLTAKDMVMLNFIAAGIIMVFLLRGIFFYGQTYLMAFVGQRVIIDIREALYRHLQRLSLSYFESRRTGALMSYITNDVAALQAALVESVLELLTESVILIGSMAPCSLSTGAFPADLRHHAARLPGYQHFRPQTPPGRDGYAGARRRHHLRPPGNGVGGAGHQVFRSRGLRN
jgi:hypothetical protein